MVGGPTSLSTMDHQFFDHFSASLTMTSRYGSPLMQLYLGDAPPIGPGVGKESRRVQKSGDQGVLTEPLATQGNPGSQWWFFSHEIVTLVGSGTNLHTRYPSTSISQVELVITCYNHDSVDDMVGFSQLLGEKAWTTQGEQTSFKWRSS